jgi:hypothetical protein
MSKADSAEKRLEPVYDRTTGKLRLVKYDSDGDGQIDNWTYTDGSRVIRSEFDTNRDGKTDRWQYYGPDRQIEKVGLSTHNDGEQDVWVYPDASGVPIRIESAAPPDGRVFRIEYYEKGDLVRAEEDSDRDGQVDKWETYEGSRLAAVAFDTSHRGTPDRRLIYGADGGVKVEVDSRGDGRFAAAAESAVERANRSR